MNISCVSRLRFLLQFHAPTKELSQVMAYALQKLTSGPWQAIPASVLTNLRSLEFSFEFADLDLICAASMCRAALASGVAMSSDDGFVGAW